MSELKIVEKLFKGRHFDREVIILRSPGEVARESAMMSPTIPI
jgi:hypothetical protein